MSEIPEKETGEKGQLIHVSTTGRLKCHTDSDTQLLKVRDESEKMKKAHEERTFSTAFEFH